MSFTILFNSRGRVPMLKQMLSRIQNTTYDLDNIEVLINIDDDDTESVNIVEEFEEEFEFVKFLINPRELNIHKHVNIMADMAQGKYIWALGDDCHIITMHWDKIAKDKLDSSLGLIRFYSNAGSNKIEHARISGIADGTSGGVNGAPGRLVFYTEDIGS